MIIIGEKINGAIPSVGEAIKSRDEGFIRALARRQTDAGADYLDVCAGTSPDTELDTLRWLVGLVEAEVETPICIDSPNAQVLADIIPSIKHAGLVNSVSGENNKCDLIYPLVADSSANSPWGIIALTCDDGGIPSTVDKKVEIACGLIDKAAKYGIAEERLFLDPLVLALSAVGDALSGFTDTIRRVRQKHAGVKFTSGLSNISYGMPSRKHINRTFLSYAVEAGMDSAIMDPTNKEMYAAILASEVLLGRDKHCRKYNGAFRAGRL
jgi:5-methyltetrahydrofolate--homocysteine methyltransferase